jgi:predicted DNA-binding transcriptional regulator AlpA
VAKNLLPQHVIDSIADAIWARMVGSSFDPAEHHLKVQLAMEQRYGPAGAVPFGLDRLTTEDTAAYLGLRPETLHDRVKRSRLALPEPYRYGKKLFWRRSELDRWVEHQRDTKSLARRHAPLPADGRL